MASANFLEEALSTDVDESAVSAIVGSLENQLVTSAPAASNPPAATIVINQNHVNSAIPNGGTVPPQQKHGATIANGGDTVNVVVTTSDTTNKLVTNSLPATTTTVVQLQGATAAAAATTANFVDATNKPAVEQQTVKILGGQAMTTTGTIISNNRVTFPAQPLPNGTIGLAAAPITPQAATVLQTTNNTSTNVVQQTIQAKPPPQQQQPQTLLIKTSVAPGGPGLVTVPMNVTASVPQVNNVGSTTSQTTPNILSNLQVVNVRTSGVSAAQKGQTARVLLSTPHLIGARSGAGAPVS